MPVPSSSTPKPLWKPDRKLLEQSNLKRYLDWLFIKKGLYFRDYHDLWDWSTTDLEDFWESIWQFFDVQSTHPYEQVLDRSPEGMIGTRWFTGSRLNYAEHIFRHQTYDRPAILFQSERGATAGQPPVAISWSTLQRQVGAMAAFLRERGVQPGDRVVSVLPNIPEAVVAFLATNAVGAVWSSCSPDFGTASIVDRFQQIDPRVLFAADGYYYNGKQLDKSDTIRELREALPTLRHTVWVPYTGTDPAPGDSLRWSDILTHYDGEELTFAAVPFDHPIWVLYSSGTTGKPKAITHSVGGCLLEHLKALALHQDVQPGERYFWYSTTGWMMWNYALGSLLVGATLVLYDGSAAYPGMDVLWNLADQAQINHFGGGAAYYLACLRAGLSLTGSSRVVHLRTLGSTGSPLPPEGFRWIYESVKKDVWLISLSGGTDVCSGFVGGSPLLPVYEGEIQCRMLGCKLEAFNEAGQSVREELGEMVILQPMPSMPIYFWNDPDNARYRSSYFEQYPGRWRHGDWIKITSRGGVIIYGRSDATLNRDGVRIGTSEIYSAVESVPEVADSLVLCLELPGGRYFMPLFVVLKPDDHGEKAPLTEEIVQQIRQALRSQYSPRHVPDAIFPIDEIPYTISGKKVEAPIKKILMGFPAEQAASRDTLRNPSALDAFLTYADMVRQEYLIG